MNKNLDFHKEKLAQILKDIKDKKAKIYSQEEFEILLEARKAKLLAKIANEKQASGQ